MYKYKRNGFTLVELMAVIIIISLIALLTFPNIINQINKTKKSNNKMIEDVVIEQAKKYIHDNDSEYTEDDEYCIPLTKLIDNDYIKEDLTSINDIKDNKVIHLTRTNSDSYEVMDKDKCVITPTAVKYLLKKTNPKTITNYTDGDIHEMYTFEHEATVQTPALTDYRYIGSDPNNYVEFNNELWRIIGVFSVEDENGNFEKKVKIIRNDTLGNNRWNVSNVNRWLGSTMEKYLNETYLFDDSYTEMVDISKWYLGGISSYPNGESFYKSERGIITESGENTNWLGKVSLMYLSDYVFTYNLGVDVVCYDTPKNCKSDFGGVPTAGWLYHFGENQFTIVPYSTAYYAVFSIFPEGYVGLVTANGLYSTRPALYLKSEVKITSGDGTKDNVYKLSM